MQESALTAFCVHEQRRRHLPPAAVSQKKWNLVGQLLAHSQQALGVARAKVARGRLEQQVPGQKVIVKGITLRGAPDK